jgi:hypothetical protein
MGKDNAINRQLALPLEPRGDGELALRNAWARTRLRVPFQVAIHTPALAICLRNIAAAQTRRKVKRVKRVRLGSRIDPRMDGTEWQDWTREETDSPESFILTQ